MIIVDDEPITCEGLKCLLDWGSLGVEIAGTAYNGAGGFELAERIKPDIIITDIKMRIMDGLEMLEKLRGSGFSGQVIILSGYGTFEYAQKAIEGDVCAYLMKPLTREKMQKAIQSAVSKLDMKSGISDVKQEDCGTIDGIISYIDSHFKEDLSLAMISKKYFIDASHLSRVFKKKTGINFVDYLTKKKLEYARTALSRTEMSIKQIAYELSYKDPKYFSRLFKSYYGVTPNEFRDINKVN